jgi:DNA-binding CsgD family transcriptional regulator
VTIRPTLAPFGTPLTAREVEVVHAYRRLASYDAVAFELGISKNTVRQHLANARSRRGNRPVCYAAGQSGGRGDRHLRP